MNVANEIVDAPQPRLGVRRLEEAKIILHRTPRVVNTLSWGAKTMAMCIPYRLDRMISPDQRSGIGQIRLPDSESPLPVHTRHVEVVNDEQSFTATLIVDHGDDLIRAEIKIASQPDGAMTLSEKLTALADVTTDEIATGLIGILNNPHWVYETGKRRITFNDKESIIDALSGVTLSAPQASTIRIDDVLEITSDKPLGTHYRAGEKMERGRATDLLFLNHLGQQRRWNSGEVISEFQVQIRRIGE